MSTMPELRRADKRMTDDEALAFLTGGFCGRLGVSGTDGWPYVVPLLYVWLDGCIYTHNTAARGHLRSCIDADPRACFEVDEPGEVFAYGRFLCDSSVSYISVIAFGRVTVVEDEAEKTRFCDALMAKYGSEIDARPEGFYPRLDQITVYRMEVERMTGKRTPLPVNDEQWPAKDRTRSPLAEPPA